MHDSLAKKMCSRGQDSSLWPLAYGTDAVLIAGATEVAWYEICSISPPSYSDTLPTLRTMASTDCSSWEEHRGQWFLSQCVHAYESLYKEFLHKEQGETTFRTDCQWADLLVRKGADVKLGHVNCHVTQKLGSRDWWTLTCVQCRCSVFN